MRIEWKTLILKRQIEFSYNIIKYYIILTPNKILFKIIKILDSLKKSFLSEAILNVNITVTRIRELNFEYVNFLIEQNWAKVNPF